MASEMREPVMRPANMPSEVVVVGSADARVVAIDAAVGWADWEKRIGKLDALLLTGPDASADRVLAALPTARYAHLATHGFFADAEFQNVNIAWQCSNLFQFYERGDEYFSRVAR